jgi:hypothetical protein
LCCFLLISFKIFSNQKELLKGGFKMVEKKSLSAGLDKVKFENIEETKKQLNKFEDGENRKLKINAVKYLDNDLKVCVPLNLFNKDLINNFNVNKLILNTVENSLTLCLNNTFVLSVISLNLKKDIVSLKHNYPIAIKHLVSENINKNQELFMQYL